MALLSLLAAGFYYHPWTTITVTGVIISAIYVTTSRRRKISGPRER
jgi:hypothetical protein